MLCCLEEAIGYKTFDHMIVNHDIATVRELRINVLCMTPNKNGKVIFATH